MAKARSIGSRLRDFRDELGLTQTDFAKQFGVSARAAQSYERDEAPPPISLLQRLAEHGIDLHELLTGRPYRKPVSLNAASYTTIVATGGQSAYHPGEIDLEVLSVVLRSAIEEARTTRDIDWTRMAQRFAAVYARHYGDLRGAK